MSLSIPVIGEELEQKLREALTALYDPDFRPSPELCVLAGCPLEAGPAALQSTIVQAIQNLAPEAGVPPSSRVRQVYDLLYNRFVLKLTLEETAERMNVSTSSIVRAQRRAVHTLARALWERNKPRQVAPLEAGENSHCEFDEEVATLQAADWHSQAERELALLSAGALEAISDISEIVASVLRIGSAMAASYQARVEVRSVQPGLKAAIHPTVLRQLLLATIARMARYASDGMITLFARQENGCVRIALTAVIANALDVAELVGGILVPEDVQLEAHVGDGKAFLWMVLPPVGRVTVLVVDDNPDMARFYHRCTEKTNYHIVHTAEGKRLFEMIEAASPDVIVLDVMLPDVDGWELLTRLHGDPRTRPIPVVIVSVVREDELALSLGAAACLAKPVQRREFIEALGCVLSRDAPTAAESRANSAESG